MNLTTNRPKVISTKIVAISLLIIVLIAVLVGGIVYWQQKNPAHPQVEQQYLEEISQLEKEQESLQKQLEWYQQQPVLPTVVPVIPIPLPSDTTANWKTYEDPDIGFSLKYPPNVIFGNYNYSEEGRKLPLSITSRKIDVRQGGPFGFGPEETYRQKEKLEKKSWENFCSDINPQCIIQLSENIYAIRSVSLSGPISCEVHFIQTLIFFKKDYKVTVTLHGIESDIINESPHFFDGKERGACWNQTEEKDSRGKFYQELLEGKGSKAAREWYETFDTIVRTLKVK